MAKEYTEKETLVIVVIVLAVILFLLLVGLLACVISFKFRRQRRRCYRAGYNWDNSNRLVRQFPGQSWAVPYNAHLIRSSENTNRISSGENTYMMFPAQSMITAKQEPMYYNRPSVLNDNDQVRARFYNTNNVSMPADLQNFRVTEINDIPTVAQMPIASNTMYSTKSYGVGGTSAYSGRQVTSINL